MSAKNISKAINVALNQGFQVSPDVVRLLQAFVENRSAKRPFGESDVVLESVLNAAIEDKVKKDPVSRTIMVDDFLSRFPDLFESLKTTQEMKKEQRSEAKSEVTFPSEMEIIKDPSEQIRPTGTEGFAQLFKNRYEKLSKIFMERPEGRQLVKISKLNMEKGNSKISGLVFAKRPTKNGIELSIDDDTGKVSVLALSEESKRLAASLSLDECVMLEVEAKQGRLHLKNIIQPDVPNRLSSTSKKIVYAVFISDLHIGSNKFLETAFDRFLLWLQGKWRVAGEDDKEMISKLKYVIIGGDIVDGVGIFPNQEYELNETNIYKQYEIAAEKLAQIPQHLQILAIPGNHDSARQALPQPMIPRKYAESLYKLKNMTMLGDPCFVKLHGVSILVYHGRSLDDVLATTPGLSYEKPTEAMKVLLRARHLAPMFGSRTPIAPEVEDHLVIEQVPDIFHSGHVHSVGADSYKSTLILNSGTWQAQTGYQANMGITPRPGLVPIVNLATLDVSFREFLTSG